MFLGLFDLLKPSQYLTDFLMDDQTAKTLSDRQQ